MGTKISFLNRTVVLFLLLLSIPFTSSYYQYVGSIKLQDFNFQDIFQLVHHTPGVFAFVGDAWYGFAGWLLTLGVALVLAALWTVFLPGRFSSEAARILVRDLVRLRLSIGILFYGILLLLSLFFPPPAISDLHTQYGAFAPWKIYFHSSAVATAGYIQTIGFIQILGAVLLLWHRTSIFGVILILFVLSNIILANFAYSIGDHLQAIYLFLLALYLLVPEIPRLYKLLVIRTQTAAYAIKPELLDAFAGIRRTAALTYIVVITVFIALAGFASRSANWPYDRYEHFSGLAGYYKVVSFSFNKRIHKLSSTDTLLWKDVVFEHGSVISVRKNFPGSGDSKKPADVWQSREPSSYLYAGNADREFFTYKVKGDSLYLADVQNNETAFLLKLNRPDSTTVVLSGETASKQPLEVKLKKVNKEYLLHKGRRKPIVIN